MKSLWFTSLILVAGCASKVQPLPSRPPASEPAPGFVWVGGEVRRAGRLPWTNSITAADAIRLADGLNDFARKRWIEVYHWDGSAEKYPLTSDRRLKQDFSLRPGDTIYVPRTCW